MTKKKKKKKETERARNTMRKMLRGIKEWQVTRKQGFLL
jgi:hypothetical protein